jgi:hypothetical protein
MRKARGNIWKLAGVLDHIVIPTSIGWRKDGSAVLGRGLARQAADKWPQLPLIYGEICQQRGVETPVCPIRPPGLNPRNLLLFPVKPLNVAQPWQSWNQPADILLIRRSLRELEELLPQLVGNKDIWIPDVGCGNGQLPVAVVRPLIESQFKHIERIVHVRSR